MAADSERRPQVLILHPMPGLERALSARFRLLKTWKSTMPLDRFLAAHAASVRAVISTSGAHAAVDAPLIGVLPSLGFVFTTSSGVDHIDLAECARRDIAVANAGTIFSRDVADYAVGLLVDVLLHVSASDRYVRRGLWPVAGDFPPGSKLGGKRVGIVGLGSIGSEIAKRLEAFGCSISYFSRNKKPLFPYTYFPTVCDLAAESDALVVACALKEETYHIINEDVMSALGKDGIIINVGRGPLVDEAELVKHLIQGKIGGAGLDVFEHEPSVPEELFSMDNVVLSDHTAALTVESFDDLVELAMENLEAFFSNRPLLTPVHGTT